MHERIVPQSSTGKHECDVLVRQAEVVISNVLRGGVLLSASLIFVGVAMFYVHYALYGVDTHPFPHSLGAVITGLVQGQASSVIILGLLVLLVTPLLRVAVSIVAFALERDWRYVIITVIVLCVLLLSFILGRGGA